MKKLSRSFMSLLLALSMLTFSLAGCAPSMPEESYSETASVSLGQTTDSNINAASADHQDNTSNTDTSSIQSSVSAPSQGTDTNQESAVQSSLQSEDSAPHWENESLAETEQEQLSEDGTYTSKEDVALYIHLYGCLPMNFITKKEAEALGWKGGSLEPYAPGMCIGGNRFGNYEGLLPEKKGRNYTECDIDTLGADKRGAKRIVFSNDGLIYYTEDHYESFELLYGEE